MGTTTSSSSSSTTAITTNENDDDDDDDDDVFTDNDYDTKTSVPYVTIVGYQVRVLLSTGCYVHFFINENSTGTTILPILQYLVYIAYTTIR